MNESAAEEKEEQKEKSVPPSQQQPPLLLKHSRTYCIIESYRKIGRCMGLIIEHILTTYGQR